MATPEQVPVKAWRVEFENGAVELHLAPDVRGEPGFGRWVTPLIAGDVETVQAVLGHQELDHTKPYLSVDQETIRRAFELAL